MLLAERLQQRRKDVQADRHAANEAQCSFDRSLTVENGRAGLLEIVEHPLAESEERRAGGGDPNLAPKPQEQLLIELLLEQQNLPADRRLRQVKLFSRARERARLRDRPQDLELTKVQSVCAPYDRMTALCKESSSRRASVKLIV